MNISNDPYLNMILSPQNTERMESLITFQSPFLRSFKNPPLSAMVLSTNADNSKNKFGKFDAVSSHFALEVPS